MQVRILCIACFVAALASACNSNNNDPEPRYEGSYSDEYIDRYDVREFNAALDEPDTFQIDIVDAPTGNSNDLEGQVYIYNFTNIGVTQGEPVFGFVEGKKLFIPKQTITKGSGAFQRNYTLWGSGSLTNYGIQMAYTVVPENDTLLYQSDEFKYSAYCYRR